MKRLQRRTVVFGWSAVAFGLVALGVAAVLAIAVIAWAVERMG